MTPPGLSLVPVVLTSREEGPEIRFACDVVMQCLQTGSENAYSYSYLKFPIKNWPVYLAGSSNQRQACTPFNNGNIYLM